MFRVLSRHSHILAQMRMSDEGREALAKVNAEAPYSEGTVWDGIQYEVQVLLCRCVPDRAYTKPPPHGVSLEGRAADLPAHHVHTVRPPGTSTSTPRWCWTRTPRPSRRGGC